jgi:hypothetical protein
MNAERLAAYLATAGHSPSITALPMKIVSPCQRSAHLKPEHES